MRRAGTASKFKFAELLGYAIAVVVLEYMGIVDEELDARAFKVWTEIAMEEGLVFSMVRS